MGGGRGTIQEFVAKAELTLVSPVTLLLFPMVTDVACEGCKG